MTITTHRDEPCWELVNAAGRPPAEEYGEGWAHYPTQREAELSRDERAVGVDPDDGPQPVLSAALSFDKPCAKIVCDGCGDELDASGEGWTHFDPHDTTPGVDWSDIDWIERDGKHYHQDCAPPWCEDCEIEGHDVDDCTASPAGLVEQDPTG